MNYEPKIVLCSILICIIILNLYVGSKSKHNKEGFLKQTSQVVLSMVPIPAIKKYYKKETKNSKNEFDYYLKFSFATFKLIVLVGILPFVMIVLVKFIIISGFYSIVNGSISFLYWMMSPPKDGVQNAALIANAVLVDEVKELEKNLAGK